MNMFHPRFGQFHATFNERFSCMTNECDEMNENRDYLFFCLIGKDVRDRVRTLKTYTFRNARDVTTVAAT